MTTDSARWQRPQAIYHDALAVSESERAAFVLKACAGDEALLEEVQRLLKHADTDGASLQNAIVREAQVAIGDDNISGSIIGAYRIDREIGQGGMGRVFLAHRNDDVYQQTVAVKLLKTSALSTQAIAMFEMERQTLARLSHVNVAVLLDGGTTNNGIPYVVMQYVDGPRVDDYADRQGLDLEARLTLYYGACAVVLSLRESHLLPLRDLPPFTSFMFVSRLRAATKAAPRSLRDSQGDTQ